MNDILTDREIRASLIQSHLLAFPIVISIKANIPGGDKNRFPAHLLVRLFSNIVSFEHESEREFIESSDGPCFLIMISQGNPADLKHTTIKIEEASTMGRFMDIDVHTHEGTLHRFIERKCFFCNEEARICQRLQKHEAEEIMSFIKKTTFDFLEHKMTQLINDSIITELDLHPKFGLVTPFDSGSHEDMNYQLMRSAKDAIVPYLVKMFQMGLTMYSSPKELMHSIRKIGLLAEQKMFEGTGGINAYKGLIFNLGFVCAALGRILFLHLPLDSLFDELKQMSCNLLDEFENTTDSFGKTMYFKYGIGGARKEMSLGLPSVQSALHNLQELNPKSLLQTFAKLVIEIEDTTLIKRAGIDNIESIKTKFKNLEVTNIDDVNELNDYCIEHHFTFGGSADLLIVTVYLFLVKKTFFTKFDL